MGYLTLNGKPLIQTQETLKKRDAKIEAVVLRNENSRRFHTLIDWVEHNFDLRCDAFLTNNLWEDKVMEDEDVNKLEWLAYVLRDKDTNSIIEFCQYACGRESGQLYKTAAGQLEDIKANIEKHYSHYKK